MASEKWSIIDQKRAVHDELTVKDGMRLSSGTQNSVLYFFNVIKA